MRARIHKTARGFTLAELLVALAIVGVLAAIIVSACAVAREDSRRSVCQSHLRQIALAVQQYLQDNDGAYPLVISVQTKGGLKYSFQWQDMIYPYIRDAHIFHCPDQEPDSSDATGLGVIDYTYNHMRLNTYLPPYPTNTVFGTNESTLTTPATIWLTVDRGWISPDGVWHYARYVSKTACGRSFAGSTLHSGGGNYAFLDGHVKWLTPEAMGDIECLNGPLPAPFKD